MSKFEKFGNNDATFAEIRENTAASDITSKMIGVKHLLRCIYNKEDVSYTEDIEKSIDEVGFTDPIEVMLIGDGIAGSGKLKCLQGATAEHRYMILSGHRRFEAALKKGIKEVPCVQINRKFANDGVIENYVLMMNCHRNNMRDPLLYYKRYIMHRDYFAGNFPDMKIADVDRAIALRMGTTDRNIRRFRAIDGNVIDSLLDMVRKEEIALSGLDRAAALTPEQQTEIYNLFQELLDERVEKGEDREISRREANRIIRSYKDGVELLPENFGMTTEYIQPEILQTVTELETVSKKIGGDIDPELRMVRNDIGGDIASGLGTQVYVSIDADEDKQIYGTSPLAHETLKMHGNHKSLLWLLDKLSDTRGIHGCDWSDVQSDDEAADKAQVVANAVIDLIDEIHTISNLYQIEDKSAEVLSSIVKAAGKHGKLSRPDGRDNMPCRSDVNAAQTA